MTILKFDYCTEEFDINCELEYEPPEKGSRQDGLQMEPDYTESMTLYEAKVSGYDIYELLDEKVRADIEEAALLYLTDEWSEY